MTKKFRYCPNCKKPLRKIKKNLVDCRFCQFHLYLNPTPSTALIIENENQEILLVKRRFPPKKDFWDLPGGIVDFGETAEQAIIREITEELGIEIKKIDYLGSFVGYYPYRGVVYQPLCFTYSTKINQKLVAKIEPKDDVAGFKFFPKDEIPWNKISFKDIKAALQNYLNST